jgi:hypothetical protein
VGLISAERTSEKMRDRPPSRLDVRFPGRFWGLNTGKRLAHPLYQPERRKENLMERNDAYPLVQCPLFGSAMGEFTVAQEGEGWIVLEDGRRVGGVTSE